MAEPKWTREKVLGELEQLHSLGIPITNNGIAKNYSGLFYAIHYKYSNGRLFESINDVREQLALRYEGKGMHTDAAAIRDYSKPRESPTKFNEEDWKERRRELIERLKNKISLKENVSIRAQYRTDRTFASHACRAFGSYAAMFKEAGIDYSQYARHLKKDPSYYLRQLVVYLKSGVKIDRTNLLQVNKKLVERLSDAFDGYYSAVNEAKKMLNSQGDKDLASKINAEELRKGVLEERGTRSLEKRKQALGKIEAINEEEADALKKTGEWLTTKQLAVRLDCSESNVYKNLVLMFPEKVKKHQYHRANTYLYHNSIVPLYKNKSLKNSPEDSINNVSRKLGISYSKTRSIMQNLGIGKRSKLRHISVDSEDFLILQEALKREKYIYENILRNISPEKTYTFRELELLGIPTSFFGSAIRRGDLPRDGKIRIVEGSTALKYFKENYDPGKHLSQGMRLVTYFNQNLYTTSDLIPIIKEDRSTIRKRLDELLTENPESCFRIRKNEKKSKVISSKEILPFLTNWGLRHDLQFVSFLNRSNEAPMKNEVLKLFKGIEELVTPDLILDRTKGDLAFRIYSGLKVYEKNRTDINGVMISRRNLHMLYHYMENHDYATVELGKRFSVEDLRDVLDEDHLLAKVIENKRKLGWSLLKTNEGLATKIIQKKGLNIDDFMGVAQDALLDSIENFDPTLGFKFSTYAWKAIDRRITQAKNDKYSRFGSLDQEVGDDAKLGDFIEVKTTPQNQLENKEVSDKINEVLESLDDKEKNVILKRFGLNGQERKTLEEIAKMEGLTRERIRQIEKKALQKLSHNPQVRLLKDAFGLDD